MASSATGPPISASIRSLPHLATYATLDELVPETGVAVFDLLDFCKLEQTGLATTNIMAWDEYSPLQADPRAPYVYIILKLNHPKQPVYLGLQRRRFDSTTKTWRIPLDVVSTRLD